MIQYFFKPQLRGRRSLACFEANLAIKMGDERAFVLNRHRGADILSCSAMHVGSRGWQQLTTNGLSPSC